MKKHLLILFCLLYCVGITAQTNNNKYTKDWEQIENYEEKRLPQSANLLIDSILQKATREKNTTQIIKGLIYKAKYKKIIDYKEDTNLITYLEQLAPTIKSVPEKGLIHSLLAEEYAYYYNNNHYDISRRTDLADLIPEDIHEWPKNTFMNKIEQNIALSIESKDILKAHTATEFKDIVIIGRDSTKFPTLYDMLMRRALQIFQDYITVDLGEYKYTSTALAVPAEEYSKLDIEHGKNFQSLPFIYYQTYLKDLLQRDMTYTAGLIDLEKVAYLSKTSNTFSPTITFEAYQSLAAAYEQHEVYTEIISKIVKTAGPFKRDKIERERFKYEWIQKGLRKYPDSYGARLLMEDLLKMEEPTIKILGKEYIYPNKEMTFEINYKNTQKIKDTYTFNLYKINAEKDSTLYKTYSYNLSSKVSYLGDTIPIQIPSLPPGSYSLDYETNPETEHLSYSKGNIQFVVSSLASFSRMIKKNTQEIFVVDRISGKPIEGAEIRLYTDKSKYTFPTIQTNHLGIATFVDNREEKKDTYEYISYKVYFEGDSCLNEHHLYYNRHWSYRGSANTEDQYALFTDRSIYRPGQTVYFKAIILDRHTTKPKPKKRCTVTLFDANREEVSEQEIVTNEFGSISGSFILPKTGLPGSYYIEVDEEERGYFSVEEYKRPTFDITFDKVDQTYAYNEEVTLKGLAKSFSGIALQEAEVSYTISRKLFSFWGWGNSGATIIEQDTVKTREDGSFDIVFTPTPGDEQRRMWRANNAYSFMITASITDSNGETQTGTTTMNVGTLSMSILIDIPDQLEKASMPSLEIRAKNLQEVAIETSGTYTLYTLDKQDSIQNKVFTGTFQTGVQHELKKRLAKLPSAKYQLNVSAKDSKGNEVNETKEFILFSYKDKRPPIETNEWIVKKNATFSKEKPAELIYGVTGKEIYLYYHVYKNEEVYEREIVRLNNQNHLFTLPYKEAYGDQVFISFTFVQEGKLFNNNILLEKEEEKEDTSLTLKLTTFRDKLRPGSEESWTIRVRDSSENAVKGEILASMYDSSLDKLRPYSPWVFQPVKKEHIYPYHNIYSNYAKEESKRFSLSKRPKEDMYEFLWRGGNRFDNIYWFGYKRTYDEAYLEINPRVSALGDIIISGYAPVGKKSFTGSTMTLQSDQSVKMHIRGVSSYGADENALVLIDGEPGNINSLDPTDIESFTVLKGAEATALYGARAANGVLLIKTKQKGEPVQVRKNFQETAFFYPQLRTNDQGETLITFTVPESNTTWRFRALAHDKEARFGNLEQFVTSQKELMVTPNLPRFFRQGDRTSISTKISNLSDEPLEGEVHIVFFDPITEEIIDLPVVNQRQPFSVDKTTSTSASWTFDVPKGIELLGCRIVAETSTFSDGEQHALAVLSNRMLVTEAIPVNTYQKGTHTFSLDKLIKSSSDSRENYRLTFEYASNPAWYAIQALPTMSNPSNQNAVNWFASYYVNSLGSFIAQQYPKVAAMIQAWKKQGGKKEAFASKLQENEELKAVLLEETPWVLEAKTETEQMERLSLLFDLNNTKHQTDLALSKLIELSNADGSWSWYKGMYPSLSITYYMLYGFAQLQEITKEPYAYDIQEMLTEAIRFIDEESIHRYELIKSGKEASEYLSIRRLEYLFVRSLYNHIPKSKKVLEAEQFFVKENLNDWREFSLYGKSLLLSIAINAGEDKIAEQITRSLLEHTVDDPQFGMYWPNNRTSVFFSISAVSSHTFMMDALNKKGLPQETIDKMKYWLLNQKHTAKWETTHATIDAIHTILSTGKDWFTETSAATIKVGDTTIESENKEFGTGYFKKTWDKSAITPQMGQVEITTTDTRPTFGGLYWQYFEDMDKVTASHGDLNIQKKLFIEKATASGKVLHEISADNLPKVGDKVVVRLTVRTNRDMEFVHIKDMHAACFEPIQVISGIKWTERLLYYQTSKDASTNFYMDVLPKGTYVLEYSGYINRTGHYGIGTATIQSMYAPEFTSHTAGESILVNE